MLDMLRKRRIYLCGSEHEQLVDGGGVEEFLDYGPEEGEGCGRIAELFNLLIKKKKRREIKERRGNAP